jgi:hypothetical protein
MAEEQFADDEDYEEEKREDEFYNEIEKAKVLRQI